MTKNSGVCVSAKTFTFRQVLADYVSRATTALQHGHSLLVCDATEINSVYLHISNRITLT